MSEREQTRLIAWNHEMRAAHERLRAALRVVRESAGEHGPARDLLTYCHGFCAALNGHHGSEDAALFPELSARYPALRPTITKLAEDHHLIAVLLGQLEQALDRSAPTSELMSHIDGISAIMESHFRYEERELLDVLAELDLDADPHTMFGPL